MKAHSRNLFLIPTVMIVLGSIFSGQVSAQTLTVLHNFDGVDARNPYGSLTLCSNVLYGTTSGDGAGDGTVFSVNPDGTDFAVLWNFIVNPPGDGNLPTAGLVVYSNVLYGTTEIGGAGNCGTLFSVNTDGTGYTKLMDFAGTNGSQPYAGLTFGSNVLYGTTTSAGTSGGGTLFEINTDGTGYAVLKNFTINEGAGPRGDLTWCSNVLYGTTSADGSVSGYDGYASGTVFQMNADGTGFKVLKTFSPALYDAADDKYTNSDGANPYAGLIVSNNVLYGTTTRGGCFGNGTVFKMSTDGTGFSVLKTFSALVSNTNGDGANPYAKLTLSGDVLYGTTLNGGSSGNGTVFELWTDGRIYSVLWNFSALDDDGGNGDGANPYAGLMLASNVLYGTTQNGGAGGGTVFLFSLQWPKILPIYGFSDKSGQQFQFTVIGPADSNLVISASTDLQNWLPLATNPLTGGTLTFTDSLAPDFPRRFYRAILLP
jgi:uncharacterized repeat protein (TIGR03803 family)